MEERVELTPRLAAEIRRELREAGYRPRSRPPVGKSEHEEQSALVAWANEHVGEFPDLEMLAAVPNMPGTYGYIGARIYHGKRLNEEGRKKGYPDLLLDVGRGGYLGWRCEMKRAKDPSRHRPGMSREQREWIGRLRDQGFRVDVCYGFEHARDRLVAYLSMPLTECPFRRVENPASCADAA